MSTSALKASPSELRCKDTSRRDKFEPAFTTEDATKYPLLTKYASRDRLEPSNNQTVERQLFKTQLQSSLNVPETSSVLKQTYQKQHVQTQLTAGGLDNDVNMAEHKEDREILSTASTRKGKKLVPLISAPLEIKHSSEIKKESTKGDSQSMTRHHKMKDSYLN